MNVVMKAMLAMGVLLAFSGCGGGSQNGPFTTEYTLFTTTTPNLTAPLAVGQSATITVLEQVCRFGTHGAGGPVPNGTGCDAKYVPNQITATVDPMGNANNQPCGATVKVTGPGTVVATRTGPGNPGLGYNNVQGWCRITITDPQTKGTNGGEWTVV